MMAFSIQSSNSELNDGVQDHVIGTTAWFCMEKGHSPLPGKVHKKSKFCSHRYPGWPHLVAENILPAVKFFSINQPSLCILGFAWEKLV